MPWGASKHTQWYPCFAELLTDARAFAELFEARMIGALAELDARLTEERAALQSWAYTGGPPPAKMPEYDPRKGDLLSGFRNYIRGPDGERIDVTSYSSPTGFLRKEKKMAKLTYSDATLTVEDGDLIKVKHLKALVKAAEASGARKIWFRRRYGHNASFTMEPSED